jgi:signal peptidase I
VSALITLVPLAILVARHRIRRAWTWWGLLMLAMVGAALSPWSAWLAAALLAALVIDAIQVAVRRPPPRAAVDDGLASARIGTRSAPPRRLPHLVLLIVVGGAVTAGVRTFVVEAFRSASASMAPTLAVDERVLAEKLSLRVQDPQPGDLLVFRNPCTPSMAFIKRVVGVAGDTVEVRCDRLFRNGAPVPGEAVPGPCTYDDVDPLGGQRTTVACQRRRETLGGLRHDILLAADAAPGAHDFPDPGATADNVFTCLVDERTPEQRARPTGDVVLSAPGADRCAPRAHYVVPPGHVFVLGDNRHDSADSRLWGPVPLDHVEARVRSRWWSAGPDGPRWDRIGAVD